tara:strand:- start:1081 stop:2037 length:957 start_codon:yes stop_codon:yes gene_type:complete
MKIYQDSISSAKYGMVGLYKTKNGVQKYAIGKSSFSQNMNVDNVFNIGSLTKTFTAVLILQDIESGKIKLNDSISDYFPEELCQNKNVDLKITIEQLLRHRSGLGEVVVDSLFNQAFQNPYFEYNNTFLFNKIPKPTSKSNTEYKYCNTNYILLGYILEIVNDKPYSELIRERIFKPCKMENSFSYYSKNIKNVAHPIYNREDLSESGYYKFYQNYAFSAGGISSNTDDLSRFFSSLYNQKLITKYSFDQMTKFNVEGYGLGLEQYKINNNYYLGHSGDNISFKVRNFYNVKNQNLLILISNQYKDKYIMKVAKQILK